MDRVNIIGAGLAGLSAAITLAQNGVASNLFSLQQSERAQSVLAEGGINGALDTMGEDDCIENHYNDTMKGGVYLADPNAVDGLTKDAPNILRMLQNLGVPFNTKDDEVVLRNFGGQKKKRTAYARSSTGKIIMNAMIDECRKYEVQGLVTRYPHHEFIRLILNGGSCKGVIIRDTYTNTSAKFYGAVIAACGGMNGIFPSMTTGTTQNSGDAAAVLFSQGVNFSNLEMIQYHPTTIGIPGKRCLVTEAARGEGGRLYIERNGEKWYFMEEKYPELKNLMPRDVVAREMFFVRRMAECSGSVCLDMTSLPDDVWRNRLSDLREEIIHYLAADPKTTPIPVKEGIHYFMGGIDTDEYHRTNIECLYAAGECTSQYHGANRLGGNSMLGAIYGGRISAKTVILEDKSVDKSADISENIDKFVDKTPSVQARSTVIIQIRDVLMSCMGIVRNESELTSALNKLNFIKKNTELNAAERRRLYLAEAMISSALARTESRGAHYREDYPETDENLRKTTVASFKDDRVSISFRELPARR